MPYSTESMSLLEHKTLITGPHNFTYSYYTSPNLSTSADSTGLPTLLFLHGYPDDAYMWAGALPPFLNQNFPCIVLDLLGFGGSSKPVDKSYYNYKKQAGAIAQILDAEGVLGNVIPIGHDWGSATAQRFYLYHRTRCVGLVLLSLAYQVPSSEPFNLLHANQKTSERFGYPQWEYWNFFTHPEAANLMRENIARFFEVNHGLLPSSDPAEKGRDVWMREMFCVPGAMEAYVTQTGKWNGKVVALKEYAKRDPEIFRRFKERMCRDGFEGPVNYYHSLKDNTMLDDERMLCASEADRTITVPLLYIGQTGDWVCRTDLMGDAVSSGLVKDLEEEVVDAGHWVLYEKPEEIAEVIMGWLLRRFPVKT